MSEFKVGDVVWVPIAGLRQVPVPCPVCFGKLVVRLELGNGDIVVLPCGNCSKGYEPPRGVVYEYTSDPSAEPRRISRIEREESESGVEVCYRDGSLVFREVFATHKDALDRAVEMAEERVAEESKRADHIKHDKNKSYAWNAGYHMREAKRAREQVAYHEKMAVLCKAKRGDGQ